MTNCQVKTGLESRLDVAESPVCYLADQVAKDDEMQRLGATLRLKFGC